MRDPTPPSVDIYPADLFQTGSGFRTTFWTVRARTTTADHEAGQRALLRMLEPGRTRVIVDRAHRRPDAGRHRAGDMAGDRGGRVRLPRLPRDPQGNGSLIGCEWRVQVIAETDVQGDRPDWLPSPPEGETFGSSTQERRSGGRRTAASIRVREARRQRKGEGEERWLNASPSKTRSRLTDVDLSNFARSVEFTSEHERVDVSAASTRSARTSTWPAPPNEQRRRSSSTAPTAPPRFTRPCTRSTPTRRSCRSRGGRLDRRRVRHQPGACAGTCSCSPTARARPGARRETLTATFNAADEDGLQLYNAAAVRCRHGPATLRVKGYREFMKATQAPPEDRAATCRGTFRSVGDIVDESPP